MKKFILAAVAALSLVACTGTTEKTGTSDTTKVDTSKVDTSKVDTLKANLVKADTLVRDTITKVITKKDTIKTKVDTVIKKHKSK